MVIASIEDPAVIQKILAQLDDNATSAATELLPDLEQRVRASTRSRQPMTTVLPVPTTDKVHHRHGGNNRSQAALTRAKQRCNKPWQGSLCFQSRSTILFLS